MVSKARNATCLKCFRLVSVEKGSRHTHRGGTQDYTSKNFRDDRWLLDASQENTEKLTHEDDKDDLDDP
jgi:hypothetical protein